MKLYTEEQVKKVWKAGQKYWETSGASITMEELLEKMTPIELPSDEEIEKELFYQKQVMNPYPTEEYAYTAYEKGFMEAAEWMRNKIQGGNK